MKSAIVASASQIATALVAVGLVFVLCGIVAHFAAKRIGARSRHARGGVFIVASIVAAIGTWLVVRGML